ncbi:hypothetical protein HHI36_023955 [Cryptolaemus montrouzieri]|uniref:Chitin-binding type-2 domain-containing protein n=1 Tax=Cryptolaemus montrouzieri TaxID=559131 RepID=A0ABD2PHT8_9CUCU
MRIQIIVTFLVCYALNGLDFTCIESGMFPNPKDATCQSYIFCLKMSDGVFIENTYTCANGTLFNSQLKTCSENVTCNILTQQTTENNISPEEFDDFNCTTQGRFPNKNDSTCNSYYFCYYLTNNQYMRSILYCPSGKKFDPILITCSASYNCQQNTTTAIIDSTTIQSTTTAGFECISQGKFPVEEDVSCSLYYYCLYLPTGAYVQRIYSCPQGTKFDWKLQTCSQNFNCTSTTTTPNRVMRSTILETFKCSSAGKYPVENTNCSMYYYCFYLPNNELAQQLYGCPADQRFHPGLQECSTDYNCPVTATTVVSSTSYFECSTVGKFPVEEDTTCTTYYYCFYLPNGEISKQLYGCYTGERFDPELQTCTHNYQCPLPTTTATSSSGYFECTGVGKFPVEQDTTCSTYYYCFYLPDGELGKQLYGCYAGEKFDPELQTCTHDYHCPLTTTTTSASSYFECTEVGKFPVEQDNTCSTYYYCFYLPTGELDKQLYSCYTGERFDPELQTCTHDYQCTLASTTVPSTRSYFECTGVGKFQVDQDTTCSMYYYCFYLPTGELGKQLYACTAGEKFDPGLQKCTSDYQCQFPTTTATFTNSYFECTGIGKFPVEQDTSCSMYYYCFYLPNGQFSNQLYGCSSGARFDPVLQKCTYDYQCPFSTTTVTSTSSYFECTQVGKFPVEQDTTCSTYYYCFYLPDGELGKQLYGCSAGERFDPELQQCTRGYQCPLLTTAATSTTGYFECTGVGKYPVEQDSTCSTYYYCFYLPNGELGKQLYGCSAGERFDPESQKCSEDYQCPTLITLLTDTSNSFKCSRLGNFSVENDITCSSYYHCFYLPSGELSKRLPNGDFGKRLYDCEAGKRFNPELQICTDDYQCPASNTKAIDSTGDFKCSRTGKFPVQEDTICSSYYYCFYFPNGEFGKRIYDCDAGKRFNPELQICSQDYMCPTTLTATTNTSANFKCTRVGNFLNEADATCSSYYYCFHLPNGEFGKQLYGCAAGERFNPELQVCSRNYQCVTPATIPTSTISNHFKCTGVGNFRVREDTTCRSYYYCFHLPNGEFGKQLYGCAAGERFNPELQICSRNYHCKALTTTETSSIANHFKCTGVGNFPVEEDVTCSSFYNCFYLPNGKFGKQLFGCAAGERFNPNRQLCERSYYCTSKSFNIFSNESTHFKSSTTNYVMLTPSQIENKDRNWEGHIKSS